KQLWEGLLTPAGPVVFVRDEGSRLFDWVPTTHSVVVISPRVCEALNAASATGWRTFPIRVADVPASEGYVGLSILGRAQANWSLSEKIERPHQHDVPAWRGLFFDPESWDGSDLFLVSGQIVVTS